MDIVQQLRKDAGESWIPRVYAEKIRPLRTRSFEMEIPERENSPAIFKTLLGVELKVGRRRFACPNFDTARYLAVFAQIGCREVAIPYDITQIPPLAEVLEATLLDLMGDLNSATASLSPQMRGRIRAKLFREMRSEIKSIGAGEMMPLFNSSTRQRDN